jgi:hypothetical protein
MTVASRLGRNDPCHCGSGKKYKHCHLAQDEAEAHAARVKAAEQAAAEAPPAAEDATPAKQTKQPTHRQTDQPWKGSTRRAFTPKARTPRKVGGS